MGRRHLSLAAAVVVALAYAATAGGAKVHWTELARGTAGGTQTSPTIAFVALDRASRSQFSNRISEPAAARVASVNFDKLAVIAIFGKFGCQDYRTVVTSIVQRGSRLVVSLTRRPIAPGTMECMSIFPTYRLLAVLRSQLSRPYPTHAVAQVAGP